MKEPFSELAPTRHAWPVKSFFVFQRTRGDDWSLWGQNWTLMSFVTVGQRWWRLIKVWTISTLKSFMTVGQGWWWLITVGTKYPRPMNLILSPKTSFFQCFMSPSLVEYVEIRIILGQGMIRVVNLANMISSRSRMWYDRSTIVYAVWEDQIFCFVLDRVWMSTLC